MKRGRKRDLRRAKYCQKFGIRYSHKLHLFLTQAFMDQLDNCKTDAARRLLLGVSR